MAEASEIRVGNVLRMDGKLFKVIFQEMRGTGKLAKTVQLKLKGLEDGHIIERGIRAEERIETIDVHHVKMQYMYKDGDSFNFMNMQTYEQLPISAKAIGKQEIFLKENMEIDVLYAEGKALSLALPRYVELKVVTAPPGVKGGDANYKEVELENGLTLLAPQFVREGEVIRVNVDDLSYIERVPIKSLS